MQYIVNCKLNIKRVVGGKQEISVIEGKGYYKKEYNEIVVFFSSEDIKYKYVYSNKCLTIWCNDSKYVFRENIKEGGELKNGDYIFRITTLASRIEIFDNCIVLDYSLYQDDLIGNYYTELSFN